ncbi:MAG: DUF5597 domain-containing protein [Tepidisphaerales bacterium]
MNMHHPLRAILAAALASVSLAAAPPASDTVIPHLRKQGSATQLIVDGQPFIMLAGELHNSSASGVEYMKTLWPKLGELGLNTVLAPVSWELIEPREGEFDFTLVDALLEQARMNKQRLVLLWFGSWKNGVSSYVPRWVLQDTKRFPRAKGSSNRNTKDILTPLSEANRKADAAAFVQLMRHIKQADARDHTVVMIQVQNEVGIKPEPRDLSAEGDAAFAAAVPRELMAYLSKHEKELHPELLRRWTAAGAKQSGTWAEVFGAGPEGAEVFSTWHYARYIDAVAEAGKAEDPLPMFVNAWLDNGGKIGSYPTGGPVAHMHDIWRAAAPHIDLMAPDIYGEFKQVVEAFTRNGNPLLIPEVSPGPDAAARVFWAVGRHDAIGFSPFGIESMETSHPLVASYRILGQIMPAITAAQGTGRMIAVYKQDGEPKLTPQPIGTYKANVTYLERLPERHPPVGGLIIQTGDEEFLMAGYGFGVRFDATTPGPRFTQISKVELGHFDAAGKWVHELRLNGDESGANYQPHIPPFLANKFLGVDRPMILKITVYRHD